MDRSTHPPDLASVEPEASGSTSAPDPVTRGGARWLSASLFGLILLCFLLPFITVTCTPRWTITGVEAATGVGVDSPHADQETVPNPLAAIALASALAGLGFGLVRGRSGMRGSFGAGLTGAIALAAFVLYAAHRTSGHIILRPGLLAAPLFVVAAALNVVRLIRLRHATRPPPGGETPRR